MLLSDQLNSQEEGSQANGAGAATSSGILFQQQFGALACAWMLAETPVDDRFGLGGAKVKWVRFETEAPVDDVLLATSEGGYLWVQAKTTVNRSVEPKSPFGRTIEQFVRQYLVCRDGDGRPEWRRPLDPAIDRLVLVLGPSSSSPLRQTLPAALRILSQPGGGALNQAQREIYGDFEQCIRDAWRRSTADPFDEAALMVLTRSISVIEFNPDGADRRTMNALLSNVVQDSNGSASLISVLTEVSGDLMKRRGGVDLKSLRRLIEARKVSLRAEADFRRDIEVLRHHSDAVANAIAQYEVIEGEGGLKASVRRDCQSAVDLAAHQGSLLVVGDPGTGKSGVLSCMARSLRAAGNDVLELAVDQFSVQSLEGLAQELKLQHGLLEVLEAWDGIDPGFLIIDALDATRGGAGERAFRTLIEQVHARVPRWKVIASIRTFDLLMGQQFRQLFRGAPPIAELADPSFRSVRHVKIPAWSRNEFEVLTAQLPVLKALLDDVSDKFRQLVLVPFNTRLIADLINGGVIDKQKLSTIKSQSELLSIYWEYRIGNEPLGVIFALKYIVQAMLETSALRVPLLNLSNVDPVLIENLLREGIVVVVDGKWVQFAHHILFDYAAAQTHFEQSALVSGAMLLHKQERPTLMLAPAFSFVLDDIWRTETDHARFWTAVSRIIADNNTDPLFRSIAGRCAAELPENGTDLLWLAKNLQVGEVDRTRAISHIVGAFGVRSEDDSAMSFEPWIQFAGAIAPKVALVADAVRLLCFLLIERAKAGTSADVGSTARAFLKYAQTLSEPGNAVAFGIGLVADTISTDPVASTELFCLSLTPDRFEKFGWQEVPAIARKIQQISNAAPGFCEDIYSFVFGVEVSDQKATSLGESRILALTSNRRQDYDMARYTLCEFFPTFIAMMPKEAVSALAKSITAYVNRAHAANSSTVTRSVEVGGQVYVFRDDFSHIWGHEPNQAYGHDGDAVLVKFVEYMLAAPEEDAVRCAEFLLPEASVAVVWARLFMIAATRRDGVLKVLWPFASHPEFLLPSDTMKDAVDVVAAGYGSRSLLERELFEREALAWSFAAYLDAAGARDRILRRVFSAIPADELVTAEAREIARAHSDEEGGNDRLVRFQSSSSLLSRQYWLDQIPVETSENKELADLVRKFDDSATVSGEASDKVGETIAETLVILQTLVAAYEGSSDADAQLKVHVEDLIVRRCQRIVGSTPLGKCIDGDTARAILPYLRLTAQSVRPEVDAGTEASFAQFSGWGSPAPRLNTAEAVGDLLIQAPSLHSELMPLFDEFLVDPHPAVRMQAGLRIIRIYELNRTAFWQRLERRLRDEQNISVLDFLITGVLGPVLGDEIDRTEPLVFEVFARSQNIEGSGKVQGDLATLTAGLWLHRERPAARAVLEGWVDSVAENSELVRRVIANLRPNFLAGLGAIVEPEPGLRQRSINLALRAVRAANAVLDPMFSKRELSAAETEAVKGSVSILDVTCMELYFVSGGSANSGESHLGVPLRKLLFEELFDILMAIAERPTPHITYYFLQTLELYLPVEPERTFDLLALAIKGGKPLGYQYESLGADLLVRLAGIYLADHKEIFSSQPRQAALVEVLETLMEAGWPAGRRLLYRLPELLQ